MQFRFAGFDHILSLDLTTKGEVFDRLKNYWLMAGIQRKATLRSRLGHAAGKTDEITAITQLLYVAFLSKSQKEI